MESVPRTFEFVIEIRRREADAAGQGGVGTLVETELLGRDTVPAAFLGTIEEEAIWQAYRAGRLGEDRDRAWVEIEPLFTTRWGRANAVDALELRVGDSTAGGETDKLPSCIRRVSLDAFEQPALDFVRRLRADATLGPEEGYRVEFFAIEPPRPSEPPTEPPRFRVTEHRTWPPTEPALLSEWKQSARLTNEEAGHPDDTVVFITDAAYEQALAACRRPGVAEGGAGLVGTVRNQLEPTPEKFIVIDGSFEMRHADQSQFHLAPTTETYVELERRLQQRRRRLDRPAELLVGIAHGHNFLPALDEQGGALCPSCPKRPTCTLHSAYYSADDVQFHQALFQHQIFAIGLVWGFTPREEDVLRIYGFRDGAVRERAIYRVERAPEEMS